MKNSGALYTEFIYPGYISLNNKQWFDFTYKNKLIGIAIDRHIESVNAIDFNNDLKEGKPSRPLYEVENSKGLKIDYDTGPLSCHRRVLVDHLEGRVLFTKYHTVLLVVHESIQKEKSYVDEMLHTEVIDFFICKYRSIARDLSIPLSSEFQSKRYYTRRYFHKFTEADNKLSLKDKLFSSRNLSLSLGIFKFHDLTESVPTFDENSIIDLSNNLQRLLSSDSLLSGNETTESIIRIGRDISVYNNFKFGLLDSFIICESLISRFLRDFKISKGISKNKLDDYEKEIPVSYLINIELPTLISDMTEKEKQLIGDLNRVRKLRNDVVHKNKDVNENDALFAFNTLQGVHNLIEERRIKYFNKSSA